MSCVSTQWLHAYLAEWNPYFFMAKTGHGKLPVRDLLGQLCEVREHSTASMLVLGFSLYL